MTEHLIVGAGLSGLYAALLLARAGAYAVAGVAVAALATLITLAVGLPLSVFPSVLDGLGRYPVKTAVRTTALLVRAPLFVLVVGHGGGARYVEPMLDMQKAPARSQTQSAPSGDSFSDSPEPKPRKGRPG